MQTESKYNIHSQYTSFVSPSTTYIAPNAVLRTFILDWVKDGKDLSPTIIAKAYEAKTGHRVTYQRVQTLIRKLGAKTIAKIRKTLLVLLIAGSLAAAQLSLEPVIQLALRVPKINNWVYSNKVYAAEPSISIPEGVVEQVADQNASPSAKQSLSVPAPSLSEKQEVMNYIIEVFGDDADRAIGVAKCESGLRKKAFNGANKNGTADYGVFQVNSVHEKRFGQGFMIDWKENVRVAKKIFDEQGFRPWVCAKSIGEKNYLSK